MPMKIEITTKIVIQMIAIVDVHLRESIVGMQRRGKIITRVSIKAIH